MYKHLCHYFGPVNYRIYVEESNTMVHEKYVMTLKELRTKCISQYKERYFSNKLALGTKSNSFKKKCIFFKKIALQTFNFTLNLKNV